MDWTGVKEVQAGGAGSSAREFLRWTDDEKYGLAAQPSAFCLRVRGILSRLTYKPGWGFTCRNVDHLLVELAMTWLTTDVADGEVLRLVRTSRDSVTTMGRWTDDEIVERWILPTVQAAEQHEVFEWFKLDGACVVDPHPQRLE